MGIEDKIFPVLYQYGGWGTPYNDSVWYTGNIYSIRTLYPPFNTYIPYIIDHTKAPPPGEHRPPWKGGLFLVPP